MANQKSDDVWWQHDNCIVPALPGTILLPSPGKLDAFAGWQAAYIERSDLEAEAAVAGRFVRYTAPAFPSPMDDGRAGQRDREPLAGVDTVDRRVQPPEACRAVGRRAR